VAIMEGPLALSDRLFTVLYDQRGWWLCDRCLADKIGATPKAIAWGVAQLYGERQIRLMRGVCFFCVRQDYVVALARNSTS
jgi:hypothetical protein